MKLVYVSNAVIPSRTANSIHIMKMCQAFSKIGHEVLLLAPDLSAKYEQGVEDVYEYYGVDKSFAIRKVPFAKGRGKGILLAHRLFKEIKKYNPDLVYGRYLPACAMASYFNFNTMFEAHIPIHTARAIDRFCFKRIIHKSSFKKLVVISEALKEIYSCNTKIPENKIMVAHDGADEVTNFDKMEDWPGKPCNLQAGYVGHLYKGRGIDIIFRLSEILADVDFHIIGGNEKDITFWQKKSSQKNLFFHGFVDPCDVQKYRNSCDLLIAPYQQEVSITGNTGNTADFMSPLKIFEYMASKKPIIASDLPVLGEILNATNSILVPPEDIDKWVSAIRELQSAKLRKQLSESAYDDFKNNYSWLQRAKLVLN